MSKILNVFKVVRPLEADLFKGPQLGPNPSF